MSVASRFAKLLVEGVDPQVYHTIRTAAEQRVKTLQDHEVQVKGKRVRVVYNAKHGRIMTAVPIKEIRSGKSPVGRRKETRGNPRSMPISEI